MTGLEREGRGRGRERGRCLMTEEEEEEEEKAPGPLGAPLFFSYLQFCQQSGAAGVSVAAVDLILSI